MELSELQALVDARAPFFTDLSDKMWEIPELLYREHRSMALQSAAMEQLGFRVERGIGGIETAFSASYGTGHPLIGILGEYDALPHLSQQADLTEPCPIEPDGNGHGCGHNLLGTGGAAAAAAIKDYLDHHPGLSGTIVYFGCPAEEGGDGKVFMLRAGCFDGFDAFFAWHPQDKCLYDQHTSAIARVDFRFHGVGAHTGSPYLGRSALDAVELMNVAANYLRGRVRPDVRIHYTIKDAGGSAGNTVQSGAEVRYFLRAEHIDTLTDVCDRVKDIARGAALMTGTRVESRVASCDADTLNNPTLTALVKEAMDALLPMPLAEEDLAYAARFRAVNPEEGVREVRDLARKYGADPDRPFGDFPMPGSEIGCRAASDVGDVSWRVPAVLFNLSAFAAGTNYHTWQMTAQGKSALAHRAMLTSAVITAAASVRLMEDPSLCARAAQELAREREGKRCENLMPPDLSHRAFLD